MEIAQAESTFAQKARNEIVEIETKLDRLLDLQLDGNLSQAEYTAKKHKLILAKKDLEEKISAFGRKSNNRFELTEKFLKYNMELANEETNEENTHLFKKVGSNFQIKDRTVLFEPRGAWRILADSGFFGGNTFVSALRADPISASDSDFQFWRRGCDEVRTYGQKERKLVRQIYHFFREKCLSSTGEIVWPDF